MLECKTMQIWPKKIKNHSVLEQTFCKCLPPYMKSSSILTGAVLQLIRSNSTILFLYKKFISVIVSQLLENISDILCALNCVCKTVWPKKTRSPTVSLFQHIETSDGVHDGLFELMGAVKFIVILSVIAFL